MKTKTGRYLQIAKHSHKYILCLCGVLVALLGGVLVQSGAQYQQSQMPDFAHRMIAILPEDSQRGAQDCNIEQILMGLQDDYNTQIDTYSTNTAQEQVILLEVASKTAVDGVILWPYTEDSEVYRYVLQACQVRDVPVFLMGNPLPDLQYTSFLGNPSDAQATALAQLLTATPENNQLVIAARSGENEESIIQVLYFTHMELQITQPITSTIPELQAFLDHSPTGYTCYFSRVIEGNATYGAPLQGYLQELLITDTRPDMFFCLDPWLLYVSASMVDEEITQTSTKIVGFGDLAENHDLVQNGTIDVMFVPRVRQATACILEYFTQTTEDLQVPRENIMGYHSITAQNVDYFMAQLEEDDDGTVG